MTWPQGGLTLELTIRSKQQHTGLRGRLRRGEKKTSTPRNSLFNQRVFTADLFYQKKIKPCFVLQKISAPLFLSKPIPSKFSGNVVIQLRLFQVISLRQSRGIRDTRPLPMSSCTFLDCCSWLNPWKGGKDAFVFPKMGNTQFLDGL